MILKRKIARLKHRLFVRRLNSAQSKDAVDKTISEGESSSETTKVSDNYQHTNKYKNVYNSYTRAICTFIISKISTPYLVPTAKEFQFEEAEFKRFIYERRETIKGIVELRRLLVAELDDTLTILSFKKGFKKLAEIFIKYFAANWICTSKLEYKLEYLKFRHRFLKGIRDPTLLNSLTKQY